MQFFFFPIKIQSSKLDEIESAKIKQLIHYDSLHQLVLLNLKCTLI